MMLNSGPSKLIKSIVLICLTLIGRESISWQQSVAGPCSTGMNRCDETTEPSALHVAKQDAATYAATSSMASRSTPDHISRMLATSLPATPSAPGSNPVLIPVPLYGPNNQILAIMNAAMLAKLLGRDLYLSGINRHYKDPMSKISPIESFWEYYSLRGHSKHLWPNVITDLSQSAHALGRNARKSKIHGASAQVLQAKLLLASEDAIEPISNYTSSNFFQHVNGYVLDFFRHRNIDLNITDVQNLVLHQHHKGKGRHVKSGDVLYAEMLLQNVAVLPTEISTNRVEEPLVIPMLNLVDARDMIKRDTLSGKVGAALDFHDAVYEKADAILQSIQRKDRKTDCTVAVHLRPYPDTCIRVWGSRTISKEEIQLLCYGSTDATKEIETTWEAAKRCNQQHPEQVPVFIAHPPGILDDVFQAFAARNLQIHRAMDIRRNRTEIGVFEASMIEQAVCVRSNYFVRSNSISSWSTVVEIFRNGKEEHIDFGPKRPQLDSTPLHPAPLDSTSTRLVAEIAGKIKHGEAFEFTWSNVSHLIPPIQDAKSIPVDVITDTVERWARSTIVVGFTKNHFEEALPFLKQAALQFPMKLIVYDLSAGKEGLDLERLWEVAPNAQVRRNPDPELPIGEFAWKPTIVSEVLAQAGGGFVLWGDASTRISPDNCLLGLLIEMSTAGIDLAARLTTGTVAQYTHPETLRCMQVSTQNASKMQMVAATNLVFGPGGLGFAKEWEHSCKRKKCIAPKGSSALGCNNTVSKDEWKTCHRFDQSVLSIMFSTNPKAQLMKTYSRYIQTCRGGCTEPSRQDLPLRFERIEEFGRAIKDFHKNPNCIVLGGNQFDVECTLIATRDDIIRPGSHWGGHDILPLDSSASSCTIVSYGLSNDVSFEVFLYETYGCHGLAMDPTVNDDGVAAQALAPTTIEFRKSGAPILGEVLFEAETSVPDAIGEVSSNGKLSLLKMDCEGCEYAIARDSPTKNIFDGIDQFIVELHIDKRFLRGNKELQGFEDLLSMIARSGMEMVRVQFSGCGENTKNNFEKHNTTARDPKAPELMHYQCLPEFEAALGHTCRLTCLNVLFAKKRFVQ